ncbi:hypothetical protein, partial [Methyloglobulus morosus]|uniref:hypothetical protein n=1 Tax=Methyloglobulus morosus TaxID=1410681 RepID=UPI0005610B26
MSENIHLHIGLGKLALGLVLGLLRPELRLVIAQRYSENWQFMRNIDQVELLNEADNVGYKHIAKVKRINKKNPITVRQILALLKDGSPVLILYDEIDGLNVLNDILDKVCSITTSVGKKGEGDIVTWLKGIRPSPECIVYPFENTEDIYKIITEHNEESTHPITIRRTIPDRICPDHKIHTSGKKAAVKIKPEEYAHIVIQSSLKECNKIFIGCEENFKEGDTGKILVTQSSEVYQYFHDKKRRLVNSIHYFLALLSYDSLLKKDIPVMDWENQYMPYLLSVVLN